MRALHLVSSLGPTATARYLSSAVPRLGGEPLVVNLGDSRPFEETIRAAGVQIETVKFRGPFDLAAAVRLRKIVNDFSPTLVHVWGNRAAAIANVLAPLPMGKKSYPLVVGDLRTASPLSRLFVQRTRRRADATRDSTPVVDPTSTPPANLGLPAGSRFILNAGGFDHRSDQRAAIWSYDMLRYVDPSLHLVVVGDGPLRAGVEQFAKSIARGDGRIHFLGVRSDVRELLAAASIAFVTHREGGKSFAAEAMATGVPVVAVESADLKGPIRDGENGLFAKRARYADQAAALLRALTNAFLAWRGDQQVVSFLAGLSGHKTVIFDSPPTAEYLALTAFGILDKVYRDKYGNNLKLENVRLYETPNCWADVGPQSRLSR